MKDWFGLVARLVTGGVWIVAGALKLPHPADSVRAVRAYDLLPEAIVPAVGHLLPVLEVVIGLCLVLGVMVRGTSVVSALLFVAFIIGISSAWARGLSIDCGCFGGGGEIPDAAAKYPGEIARDVGLLALSLWLVVRPRRASRSRRPVPLHRRPRPDHRPTKEASMAQKKTSHRTAEEKAATRPSGTPAGAHRAGARAGRGAPQGRKRKEQLTRVGLIAGVLVLIVGGYFLISNLGSDKPDTPPAGASGNYGLRHRRADAPKEIVVYEDFLCPFCGQLELTCATSSTPRSRPARSTSSTARCLPRGIDDYSPESANAFAVVLDESGPEVAKAFHDLLFDNQPSEEGPFPDADDLVDLAVEAGATRPTYAPASRTWRSRAGSTRPATPPPKAGVNSTPTVLVDGEKVEGQTIAEIAAGRWSGPGC